MAEYNVIFPMLESMQDDMKALSAKKPDMLLTTFKVKMVNKLISAAREILASESTLEYLPEELDEVNLPQHSDVVIVLRQYLEALAQCAPKNPLDGFDPSIISDEDLKLIIEILSKYQ